MRIRKFKENEKPPFITINEKIYNAARTVLKFQHVRHSNAYRDDIFTIIGDEDREQDVIIRQDKTYHGKDCVLFTSDGNKHEQCDFDPIWVTYLFELSRVAQHFLDKWHEIAHSDFLIQNPYDAQKAAYAKIIGLVDTMNKPKILPPVPPCPTDY